MQSLRVHQETAMLHLLKLYKANSASRHLVSCVDCTSAKTASQPSSLDALFKKHNLRLMPLLPGVNYRHSHCSSSYLSSVCYNSISHRPSYYEKMELKLMQTSFPLCVPARCKQTSSIEHLLTEAKSKEYISLYLHKSIQILRTFCTVTKYSTLMFVTTSPICVAASLMDMLPLESSMIIIGSLFFYTSLFSAQNYLLLTKFLCQVMISTDKSYVKISHLTLFGKRRDLYVKPSDIIPVSGSLYDKKFHTVRFKNSSKKLYFLPHSGGDDTNYEVLDTLFTRDNVQTETEPKE